MSLNVMVITPQVDDPLKAGMALGTAMRLDAAMRDAAQAGLATAAISVADLNLLLEFTTPFIQRVASVIYEAEHEREQQEKADREIEKHYGLVAKEIAEHKSHHKEGTLWTKAAKEAVFGSRVAG